MKITLIGAGNLATNIAIALKNAHHQIIEIYSRTEASAKVLAQKVEANYLTELSSISDEADLYLFSVSDSVLSQVIKEFPYKEKLVAHTAGSLDIDLFSQDYAQAAVFYPLQTFSKTKKVDFSNIPICLEARDHKDLLILQSLAESISEDVRLVSSYQRKAIHMAAVFSCNFTNHLMHIADQLLEESHMNFDILLPLIEETLSKLNYMPPRSAQTGPAVREDFNVVNDHLQRLSSNQQYHDIYKLLSESIIKTHREG